MIGGMVVDKRGIMAWVKSVRSTWTPREAVPRGEASRGIPEEFLATSLRYLEASCDAEQPIDSDTVWRDVFTLGIDRACGSHDACDCRCHDLRNGILMHDHACCSLCDYCGVRVTCPCERCRKVKE